MRGQRVECISTVRRRPHFIARKGLHDGPPESNNARQRSPPINSVQRCISAIEVIYYN